MDLGGFAALMERETSLQQAICNPLYDATSRRRVLSAVIEQLKLSRVMSSFLLLVLDKGRFGFLSGVNDCYQKFADELKGIARASVTSATPLSAEVVEKIKSALSKKTGMDVFLEMEHDPGL